MQKDAASSCPAETKLPAGAFSKVKFHSSNVSPCPTGKGLLPCVEITPTQHTWCLHPGPALPPPPRGSTYQLDPPGTLSLCLQPLSGSRITWHTCSWAGPRDTARAASQAQGATQQAIPSLWPGSKIGFLENLERDTTQRHFQRRLHYQEIKVDRAADPSGKWLCLGKWLRQDFFGLVGF